MAASGLAAQRVARSGLGFLQPSVGLAALAAVLAAAKPALAINLPYPGALVAAPIAWRLVLKQGRRHPLFFGEFAEAADGSARLRPRDDRARTRDGDGAWQGARGRRRRARSGAQRSVRPPDRPSTRPAQVADTGAVLRKVCLQKWQNMPYHALTLAIMKHIALVMVSHTHAAAFADLTPL